MGFISVSRELCGARKISIPGRSQAPGIFRGGLDRTRRLQIGIGSVKIHQKTFITYPHLIVESSDVEVRLGSLGFDK